MGRPSKKEARDTRALALDLTHDLLHQHGYMGVSMDDVAKVVGVRKASLYHHFPQGKEQLVLEIADLANAHAASGFAHALDSGADIQSQLLGVARYAVGERRQASVILRDAMRFMTQNHQEHIYKAFFQGQYLPLRATFEAAVERGELRPHDTERSTWAFLGLLSEMTAGDDPSSHESLVQFIVDLVLNGLKA